MPSRTALLRSLFLAVTVAAPWVLASRPAVDVDGQDRAIARRRHERQHDLALVRDVVGSLPRSRRADLDRLVALGSGFVRRLDHERVATCRGEEQE